MDKVRYIDFNDDVCLIEKSLSFQGSKLRYVDIQKQGETSYIFEQIYTIFAFNKERCLQFNVQDKEKLPIFDTSIDKIYILAKMHNRIGEKLEIKTLKANHLDPMLKAIHVVLDLLKHEKEVSDRISSKFNSTKIEHDDTDILDLLYNLMDEPDTVFYPFHGYKKKFGFIPDPSFSIPFSSLKWRDDELTLCATVNVPGVFRFPISDAFMYQMPSFVETYSTITVSIINKGKLCFDKIMISNNLNKGFISLAKYPILLPSKLSINFNNICSLVHKRNMLIIYHVYLNSLQKKVDVSTKIKDSFTHYSDIQKTYLKRHRITENGFESASSTKRPSDSFNVIEDELTTFLRYFEEYLKEDSKDAMTSLVFNVFTKDMRSMISDKLKDETSLKDLILKSRRELNIYDHAIQKFRFYITFNSEDCLDKEIKLEYDSFNFLLQSNNLR